MKQFVKFLFSPLFVAITMIFVFFAYHLYPFAENTLAWCDMTQQVIPLLLDFKDILTGNGNLFLNMQNAGGMNFWGVFLFFIASPFSFLVIFIEKQDMSLFMNILVLLKMMCCALTANIFFQKQFPNLHFLASAFLSVMYAFCGYSMLFYQNVVWLDIMALFPLLLLSFSSLISSRKITFYVIIFSSIIIINFYLSYMVVLFLILLMGLYLLFSTQNEKRKESIFFFALGSILSILITCPVWLPSLFQYFESARTGNLIQSLSSGNFLTSIYTNLPLLFCTAIIFSALPFLFFNKQKHAPKTNAVLILFLLTLVPIVIEPINKMWHTGSYQAFPMRYGYITIFLGLILTATVLENIQHEKTIKVRKRFVAVMITAILVFFSSFSLMLIFFLKKLAIYTKTLWGSSTSFFHLLLLFLLSFMCYFLAIYLFKYRLIPKSAFLMFLCLLTFGESFYNASIYIGSTANNVDQYRQAVDLSNNIHNDSFYRVKLQKKYFDVNLLGGLGYNCLNHYTSLTSEDYMFGMKKLGYSSYWMEVNSTGGTKFTDAFLCNQYKIKKTNEASSSERIVYQNQTYCITETEQSLPLGIKYPASSIPEQTILHSNRFDAQAFIFSSLFPTSPTPFKEVSASVSSNIELTHDGVFYQIKKIEKEYPASFYYYIPVKEQSTLYFDCFSELSNNLKEPINQSFRIIVNGKTVESSYPSQKNSGIVELGSFENEAVSVEIDVLKDTICRSFGVYQMTDHIVTEAIQSVDTVVFDVYGRKITGQCQGSGEEYLHLSVPYDKGFSAKINGERVQIQKVNDMFIALKLQSGENRIELFYTPPGLKIGLFISAFGFSLFLLIIYSIKKGNMIVPHWLRAIFFYCFIALFLLTIFGVYMLPVIVYFIV